MVQPPVPSDNHAKRLSGEAVPSGPVDHNRATAFCLEWLAADYDPNQHPQWLNLARSYLRLRRELAEANNELHCCDDIPLDQGLAAGIGYLQADRESLRAALGNAPPSDGGMGPATHEGPSGNGLNQNPPTGDQP